LKPPAPSGIDDHPQEVADFSIGVMGIFALPLTLIYNRSIRQPGR
jgi:hypothetical protein